MQDQANIALESQLVSRNVGFSYNSATRIFKCLDQTFDNVAIYEMDVYTDIAVNNHNHKISRQREFDKPKPQLDRIKQKPLTVKPEQKKPSQEKPKPRTAKRPQNTSIPTGNNTKRVQKCKSTKVQNRKSATPPKAKQQARGKTA